MDDDELLRQLDEMVDAVWRLDSHRGYECRCGCGLTFIDKYAYFRHRHPSARGQR